MRRFIIFLFLSIITIRCFGNDVTIVSEGTGKNKSEATMSALRFALTEAYGTYISSRSSIDANDLFSDETVMITNGNIKSYKEISYNESSHTIKLSVVVSLDKLNNYIENHGSSVSIDGSRLIANREIKATNRGNTDISFNHFLEKLTETACKMYNYSLTVGEPKVEGNFVYLNIFIKCTDNIEQQKTFNNIYNNSLRDIYKKYDMSDEYVKYQVNNYQCIVNKLNVFGFYSFILKDNLGNNVEFIWSDTALREHPRLMCCERFNNGAGIYCKSYNYLWMYRNGSIRNGNNIKFTLKYKINDFKMLKNIEVLPD